jgi:hypothetical protein
MTMPPGSRDTEARLIAALTDTARRNLSDAPPPPFRQLSEGSPSRPTGRIRTWALPVLAAAVVVAVTVALIVPNRGKHYSAPPAGDGPGTLVTLRARTEGLSTADLHKARQIISARAAALGAEHADVRIVGPDEIAAFLPGVATNAIGDLGAVNALQIRPLVWFPPMALGTPATPKPTGIPRVVDPWKSLGFAPPKDEAAYGALSRAQRIAVQAVINNWHCGDLPLDRASEPIVTCDQDRNFKYLLGPVIVASNEIESVVPAANQDAIAYQWQIAVKPNPAGSRRLIEYTAQHNEIVRPNDMADWIVDTLDSVVIGQSPGMKPITDGTFAAGIFDQRGAGVLAANLTAGPLPAPFDVVSIQGR